jgi:single-strand DNA-binding protein
MELNKVMLCGNLTKDIEVKKLTSGDSVASFTLAVNKSWKDEKGEKKEKVAFINCVVFKKKAEALAEWNKKGDKIFVEGEIVTRSWDKKDGSKGYATEIKVDNWDFVQKKKGVSEDEKYGFYNEGYKKPSSTEEELPIIDADDEELTAEELASFQE